MGYHRAGFDVVGVDISPQPNYPFWFVKFDALEYLSHWDQGGFEFSLIHASPPCQKWSRLTRSKSKHPALIEPTRDLLDKIGLPYVIENVPEAPLIDPTILCGAMFGLELYRHRGFESPLEILAPNHPPHTVTCSRAGHWEPGTYISVAGHCSPVEVAKKAMGIDWTTRDELSQAIPPRYTEYIGKYLLACHLV
ncbi:MAG TPA: hypothetical protein VGR89_10130 [Puia sp.]|nr:hypothetical protein [Puia sp.]